MSAKTILPRYLDVGEHLHDLGLVGMSSGVQTILEQNSAQEIRAYNNFDGGGPYGDDDSYDAWNWMNAEMSRKRYDEAPHLGLVDGKVTSPLSVQSFAKTETLGAMAQAHIRVEIGSPNALAQRLIALADSLLSETSSEPLHIPFASDAYGWGSNGNLANIGLVLGHAYQLTGERKYRDGVVDIMDYFLGRNPLGVSYVTGYGDRPFENPHHRHWAHSVRDGAPKPPPGVLSGGPNNDNMSDPVAVDMIGTCAAQTCWTDDYGAWTQNEVTINWNAPFFWMAAFLDATEAP